MHQQNIFWRQLTSEFYEKQEIYQESYKCLNAFLNVPEIIEIQTKKYLGENEYEKYKNTICKLSEFYKQHNQERFNNNLSGNNITKSSEEKCISDFMEKSVLFLILQEMCNGIGRELFDIQENQVKYEKYSNYRYSDLGAHTPSPVIDLITGNEKRGTFYKKIPRKRNQVYRFKYRKDGNLISAFSYLKEKPRYFCSILYSENYIFYLKYRIVGDEESDIYFLSYIDVVKCEGDKPEYLEKTNYFPDLGICSIDKESYIYKKGNLDKWIFETYLFPVENGGLKYGKLCRTLYTVKYDKEGYICNYTSNRYMGSEARIKSEDNLFIQKHIVQREKSLDTGKDAVKWQYPPNYFSCQNRKK